MSDSLHSQPYPGPRPSAVLPLVLAGAALVLTGWMAYERFWPRGLYDPGATPRTVTPRGELASFERTAIDIFDRNAPSVVDIRSPAVRDRWTGRVLPEATGTGFVWNEQGYIVTNYHVVQQRTHVEVRMLGATTNDAVVVGSEPSFDVAVLKLANHPGPLRPIELGRSKGLRVGQAVFAIGGPFGLERSLSTGVVSALDRVIESVVKTPIDGVIQVDATINPGNSGGPLLDSAGLLIGMNTAIFSPTGVSAGIGFAVPADSINRVATRLIAGDSGQRPVLGVMLSGVVRLGDGSRHPMIDSVVENSGAAAAGLRGTGSYTDGDIILSIDGLSVNSVEDLRAILDQREVGDTVQVEVLRHEGRNRYKPITVAVELRTEVQRDGR